MWEYPKKKILSVHSLCVPVAPQNRDDRGAFRTQDPHGDPHVSGAGQHYLPVETVGTLEVIKTNVNNRKSHVGERTNSARLVNMR